MPVSPEQVARWLRALHLLRCEHPADLYWSGRVTLVTRREHLPLYDEWFRRFWLTLDHPALRPEDAPWAGPDPATAPDRSPERRRERENGAEGETAPLPLPPGASTPEPDFRADAAQWLRRWSSLRDARPDGPPPPEDMTPTPGQYSPVEILRREARGLGPPLDRAALQAILALCRRWEPEVCSRRWGSARRGPRLDLRRTLALAARTGGDPVLLARRRRRRRWRRWVFLCDISGSMGPYLRDALLVLQAVARHRPGAEVFLFGTRLTRVTPLLRRSAPGRLDPLLPAVQDWEGGTRLGQALRTFHREYGRRGMAHGALLVILSDGLDQGEPGLVGEAMAALRRLAWRVVWVNPLKRSPDYRPLAQAMAEALPYVDELLGGHNLASLAEVLARLAEMG